jgi:hypothetical protein
MPASPFPYAHDNSLDTLAVRLRLRGAEKLRG